MLEQSDIVLGECMLWNEKTHGKDKDSTKNIETHWIFHNNVEVKELPEPSFPWLRIEIARLNYLEGGECSAIFKTYWLKIVQREWKRIYKTRLQVKRERNTPKSITYYQRYGKWPPQINYLPSLKDMRV